MEYSTFVRKPFVIEAIEVTLDNIEELCPLVGELRAKADGSPFILVNRRLVPNVYKVYPGFWITRMGDNIRCYSRRIFLEQFTLMTDEIGAWVVYMDKQTVPIQKVISDPVEEIPVAAYEVGIGPVMGDEPIEVDDAKITVGELAMETIQSASDDSPTH
jgi:hypothetical protein